MRVVVIGAGGLLGTAFQLAAKEFDGATELLLPCRQDLDVTQQLQVERYLTATRPDVVVNAAALLPADLCEAHPRAAYEVHALGARWVALCCARIGALDIYISTDFVFDGTEGVSYPPQAPTRPLLGYGITKLAGELETAIGAPRHLVLRTAGLFGPAPVSPRSRGCFVDRILDQAVAGASPTVVDSVVMSPTYTVDLARMVFTLAADDTSSGTYHAVNSGQASWYQLAAAAVELAGLPVPVLPAATPQQVSAARPTHTPLVGRLPGRAGTLQRPWHQALAEYLEHHWVGR